MKVVDHAIRAIIHSITAVGLYSTIVIRGYAKSVKDDNRRRGYLTGLQEVIEELKNITTKEEDSSMLEGKGAYKNINKSEGTKMKTLAQGEEAKHKVTNKNTLGNLLTNKPTEENYAEIIDLLTEVARKTYAEYKFFIARSTDETEQPNFIQIVSHSSELPELHKLIFAKSIDYGINMPELQGRFADRIAKNKVIDLGEDVIVITDDNTGIAPSGVSPINSGLEGGEIAFIISFLLKENLEAWEANTFPKEEAASE